MRLLPAGGARDPADVSPPLPFVLSPDPADGRGVGGGAAVDPAVGGAEDGKRQAGGRWAARRRGGAEAGRRQACGRRGGAEANVVDSWVDNTVASISGIIDTYGVDVDYEHFGDDADADEEAAVAGRWILGFRFFLIFFGIIVFPCGCVTLTRKS